MRFNFSTLKHGKCLIEVNAERDGAIATIWFADRPAEPGTMFAGSQDIKVKFGNVLTARQVEQVARMAIHRFEAHGSFPGKTHEFLLGHEWQGELIPLV